MRTAHQLSWTGWGGRSRVGSLLAYPPPIKKEKPIQQLVPTPKLKIINKKKSAA